MKLYQLVPILLLVAACKKPGTTMYSCKTPQILLYQEGYSAAEWDTIITQVYEPGYQLPVLTDTFVAADIANQLLISPVANEPKDFLIILPSVDTTYRLHDIKIATRSNIATTGQQPDCYHGISFILDGKPMTDLIVSDGKVYASLKK